jgi:hypothetical protein
MRSFEESNGFVGLDEAVAEEVSFNVAALKCEGQAASIEENTRRGRFTASNEQAPSNGEDVKEACF